MEFLESKDKDNVFDKWKEGVEKKEKHRNTMEPMKRNQKTAPEETNRSRFSLKSAPKEKKEKEEEKTEQKTDKNRKESVKKSELKRRASTGSLTFSTVPTQPLKQESVGDLVDSKSMSLDKSDTMEMEQLEKLVKEANEVNRVYVNRETEFFISSDTLDDMTISENEVGEFMRSSRSRTLVGVNKKARRDHFPVLVFKVVKVNKRNKKQKRVLRFTKDGIENVRLPTNKLSSIHKWTDIVKVITNKINMFTLTVKDMEHDISYISVVRVLLLFFSVFTYLF